MPTIACHAATQYGANFWGIPSSFQRYRANYPISGKNWVSISKADAMAMGFNLGEAQKMTEELRRYFFSSFQTPPHETYATWDPPGPIWTVDPIDPMKLRRKLVKANPIEVSTTVVLEALIGIDEANFFFEVQFLLVMSWRDERINRRCTGTGACK